MTEQCPDCNLFWDGIECSGCGYSECNVCRMPLEYDYCPECEPELHLQELKENIEFCKQYLGVKDCKKCKHKVTTYCELDEIERHKKNMKENRS